MIESPARRLSRTLVESLPQSEQIVVLGAGLEPACLSAYAPQTYVSAIPPPERSNLKCAQKSSADYAPCKPPFRVRPYWCFCSHRKRTRIEYKYEPENRRYETCVVCS